MVWQDIVITICAIAFSYALIPQVYQGFKKRKSPINLQTSLITTISLYVLAITFLTLEFYFSTIMNTIAGTLWLILLIQKITYK